MSLGADFADLIICLAHASRTGPRAPAPRHTCSGHHLAQISVNSVRWGDSSTCWSGQKRFPIPDLDLPKYGGMFAQLENLLEAAWGQNYQRSALLKGRSSGFKEQRLQQSSGFKEQWLQLAVASRSSGFKEQPHSRLDWEEDKRTWTVRAITEQRLQGAPSSSV